MSHIKRVLGAIAILALTLLGATPAWAGRGDIDPNYGAGGALAVEADLLVGLPGNRLAIFAGGSVSLVDSNGFAVTTFGDGGQAAIPTPADNLGFQAMGAAPGPDGQLLVYGILQDAEGTEAYEAILLLDGTGHADSAFGGQEDGYFRVTGESIVMSDAWAPATLVGYALDLAGRIVLLERTVSVDGVCDESARIRRLLPTGEEDVSFGTGGTAELASIDLCINGLTFGVRTDGSIVVGRGSVIFSINAAGGFDAAFGEQGRLSVGIPDCCTGFLLPDGGLLLLGSVEEGAFGFTDTALMRFNRNGEPDTSFGGGTGYVTIDLAAELLGGPGPDEFIERVMLSPNDSGFVVQLRASGVEQSRNCYGIAKLASDGRADISFGDRGLTCLSFGYYQFDLVSVQEDGASIFTVRDASSGIAASVHRLLADATPSPGIITVARSHSVNESAGAADVVEFARVAGRDGAVSMNYATVPHRPSNSRDPFRWDSASAGTDYTTTSGRLDWATGDDSRRTLTVNILNDDIDEIREAFGVGLSEPGGGIQLIGASASIFIDDDDEASSTPPPTGGGGSVSWATQLALLTLLLHRRRRNHSVGEHRQ